MLMSKTMMLAAVFCLVLGLAACDNTPPQPIIPATDAIKLAKQAAAQLKYPPRRADQSVSGGLTAANIAHISYPNEVSLWPDMPATANVPLLPEKWWFTTDQVAFQHGITATIALETVVDNPASGGVDVTFISQWHNQRLGDQTHRWRFHISAAGQVSFVGEQGDKLITVRETTLLFVYG